MKVVHPEQGCEVGVAKPANPEPEPRMNIHKNARMTVHGRALLIARIEVEGWRVAKAAEAAGVSQRTAYKWLSRYRTGGAAALHDRKPTAARCPHRLAAERVAEIERLRRQRLSGPTIARQLGLPRATVGAVLRRLGLGRLAALDPKPPAIRYQRQWPGELIHIDTKKLGRIDGVGHRITGCHSGMVKNRGIGWDHLHVCVDDASRLAYTEILPDERKESACAFLSRALAFLQAHGVRVERVMTDNGSAYRSHAFRDLITAIGLKHLRTRPYTPRTNGKAERFIQTSLREWAYLTAYQTSAERARAMQPWITNYNHCRPHSALAGRPPVSTLNNALGNDT
jgi:transposase InsO family protein